MPDIMKRYGPVIAFWGMIVIVMTGLWGSPLISGQLPDSDDYMRMLRVFDKLDHTGTPSYIEPRLGVEGSEMGWSRLVDWPLIAVQATAELLIHDRTQAALLTATISEICATSSNAATLGSKFLPVVVAVASMWD